MKLIDWEQPIETGTGFPAERVCRRDVLAPFVNLVVVDAPHKSWEYWVTDAGEVKGEYFRICNKPISHSYWVNCYRDFISPTLWSTRESADRGASIGRIACVEITWEEEGT
jgi:hypothetical protein